MDPDPYSYFSSLGEELKVQARRVRQLIGDAHWLTDGHHKEFLLTSVIERHLPVAIRASRGFVLGQSEMGLVSREQDILLTDTFSVAPVFSQGGVSITYSDNVVGTISVKTVMARDSVLDSLDTIHSASQIAIGSNLWLGSFFFEVDEGIARHPSSVYDAIEEYLRQRSQQVICPCNVLASADQLVFVWDIVEQSTNKIEHRVRGFRAGGQGTALFLGSLIDHLANYRGKSNSQVTDFIEGIGFSSIPESERIISLQFR